MNKKKRILLVFLGVKWILALAFFATIVYQFKTKFTFNLLAFDLFLLVLLWTIWRFQFDFEARRELERVNLKFHALGRAGRRKFARDKGVSSVTGSKIRKYK